jgi:hypothetical protein
VPTFYDLTKISQAAQRSQGMPEGLQFYSPFPFAGINTQASPIAIDDKEFTWIENFVRLGDGRLRTLWDVGPPVYTRPGASKIVGFFFYNIGTENYVIVFHADGSAYQRNMRNGAITTVSTVPGIFFKPGGSIPACSQWGTEYLIIANRNTPDDYWLWDGSTLWTAGTVAPNAVDIASVGANYSSFPTVTAFGGHGTGATFTGNVNAGGVVEITPQDPGSGYQPGDIVQLAFTGGGSDTSAILQATLAHGSVVAVNITNPGSNYTNATVAFSGGGGSGAAGTVNIGSGISNPIVTNPGSGYTNPQVGISGGGGSGAELTAVVDGGQIISLTVAATGSGYTSPPAIAITDPTGTGAMASCSIQGGIVTGVTMTSFGMNYTSAPTVTITGDGLNAAGVAVISSNGLAAVNVINPGSGFTQPPQVKFEGGGGSGAEATVTLNPTSIAHINVINGASGITETPYVYVNGGGPNAHGCTAHAVLNNGSVSAIIVDNGGGGYQTLPTIIVQQPHTKHIWPVVAEAVFTPTSIQSVTISNYGQNYSDAPAVIIQPGSNNSAYATVSLMPYGVSGDSIETFQSRVWIANPAPSPFAITPPGGLWQVSAPSQFPFTDFATSDGGVEATNSDSFLQTQYVGLKQSNGYLYFFGDGSVSVASNVQTSGNPATTTYNYQNVDPQIGLSWRDTLQAFSRTDVFANATGVFGLYGGAVTKISDKLQDFFSTGLLLPFGGGINPSGAVATIFDVRHYVMLATVNTIAGFRTLMFLWNEKEWTLASQSVNLIYIGTQKVSSQLFAWGTDGDRLYQLFAQPSSTLTKRIDTKYYGANNPFLQKDLYAIWVQASDQSQAQSGVGWVTNVNVGGIAIQDPNYPSMPSGVAIQPFALVTEPNFPPNTNTLFYPVSPTGTEGIPFLTLGLSMTTTSPDFILGNLVIGWTPTGALL